MTDARSESRDCLQAMPRKEEEDEVKKVEPKIFNCEFARQFANKIIAPHKVRI